MFWKICLPHPLSRFSFEGFWIQSSLLCYAYTVTSSFQLLLLTSIMKPRGFLKSQLQTKDFKFRLVCRLKRITCRNVFDGSTAVLLRESTVSTPHRQTSGHKSQTYPLQNVTTYSTLLPQHRLAWAWNAFITSKLSICSLAVCQYLSPQSAFEC